MLPSACRTSNCSQMPMKRTDRARWLAASSAGQPRRPFGATRCRRIGFSGDQVRLGNQPAAQLRAAIQRDARSLRWVEVVAQVVGHRVPDEEDLDARSGDPTARPGSVGREAAALRRGRDDQGSGDDDRGHDRDVQLTAAAYPVDESAPSDGPLEEHVRGGGEDEGHPSAKAEQGRTVEPGARRAERRRRPASARGTGRRR